ncbi:ThuA domain-containing protein [Sanguibacter sp. 25GB23B1]|uniref:ThuA domain-containing protein n=1 Tax=unclassified Sanguibacter TaxID=2645534 RepID=UPI0032AF2B22
MASHDVKRVLVLSGRGRYEDPWHDMAAISHRVATILAGGAGERDVVVRGCFPDAARDLTDVDLLVVNTASGRPDAAHDGDDARWAPFHESVRAWADAGRPVLALHQAANSFADSPHWERILGGRWVDGTSMHPEIGDADFELLADEHGHPLGATLATVLDGQRVSAFDERYSYLRVADDAQVLLSQRHDGVDHPVVWVNEADGLRVVYDALGHDLRSYDSPSRRALLLAEVDWLLGR